MAIVNSRAAIEPKTGKAAIFVNETIHSLMRKLFSNGEQGFAYDPNDLTTLYQDAAGTIPVTAAGQPVGLMKDKSGRNNHAYQTVSASRPLLQRNATTGAYYLAFDGADDSLQTNSIDFTATDKVSLFAGVRVLSDASTGVIASLGNGDLQGSFMLFCGGGGGYESYTFASRGSGDYTAYSLFTKSAYPVLAATKSSVVVSKGDNSAPLSKLNVDSIYSNISTDNQGAGNYGNYPLYIGRRGETSYPFNGHLYSLIGIGRLTADSETIALEKAIAKNTGVTLNV